MIMLIVLLIPIAISASDEEKKKLFDALKEETFHTQKKSPIDPFMQKQIEELERKQPALFQKMLDYTKSHNQKENPVQKKNN